MSTSLSEISYHLYQEGGRTFFAIITAIGAWFSTHAEYARCEREVEQKLNAIGGTLLYGRYDWEQQYPRPQPVGFSATFTKALFGERHICGVYIRGTELPPDLAERIATLPYLENFRAEIAGLDEARIRPFLKATHLRSLQISENDKLDDDALTGLSQLHRLRMLDLSGTPITDRTWAEICSLPELEMLNVSRTKFAGSKQPHAKGLPNLQEVWAERCSLSDDFGEVLASSKKLRLIFFKNARTWTDEGVNHLTGHATLERVSMGGTGITDKSLDVLVTLPKLRRLSKANTKLTIEATERFRIVRPEVDLR